MSIAPSTRYQRAEAAFDCPREDLPAALMHFAGQEPPPHPQALPLLARTLALVADEPELPDWLELARIWQWFGRIDPHGDPDVLALPARAVLKAVREQVAALDEETLRGTVLALAPRSWLLDALADAVHAHAPDRDDPVDPTATLSDHMERRQAREEFWTTAAQHEAQAVTADPPDAWGPAARTALTCALVWRLTALAAVFAHVASEPTAPPAAWQRTAPDRWQLTELLPGAAAPVTLEVTKHPATSQELIGLPLAVEGPYGWTVTWDDPATRIHLEGGQCQGRPYAQWQALQALQILRRTPGGARHAGRLLVPVDPAAPGPEPVPVRTVRLDQVLTAVLDRFPNDPGTPPTSQWVSLPHCRHGEPISAAAAILAALDAPYPTSAEPANEAAVDSRAFTDFLASHAIALTPATRAYLAGLADSGPGPDALTSRHQTAMRSLLALLHTSEPAAAQARTEIGPPPADGYRALLDPHRLLEHLSFHAPHEDRPIGLDPDQLATVRQQICQGMAAVTLAHMRNHLAHRPDTNADFKDMVRSAVRRMNSFPDPDSGLADQTGPGDHLLPDPPIRYTVSFHTCDDVDQVSLIYSTAEPGPAHLNLLVPADWGPTIATPGQAVLAGRPVTGVLHRDQNGRPTTVWVVEVEEVRPTPSGDRTVWHLAARSKLADVDWSSGRPRLFTPEPADSP